MRKNYKTPAVQVVIIEASTMMAQSMTGVTSNADISYGGRGTSENGGASARVKGSGDNYDVWNDDWSE